MPADRFSVELTRSAEKDLERLRGLKERATRAVLRLEVDPHLGHTLTGSLRGVRSLEFSMPGGAYRAAYVILLEARTCVVFLVGPHEDFYKRAERRYAALRVQAEQSPPDA